MGYNTKRYNTEKKSSSEPGFEPGSLTLRRGQHITYQMVILKTKFSDIIHFSIFINVMYTSDLSIAGSTQTVIYADIRTYKR
jgi:hypothetical protein